MQRTLWIAIAFASLVLVSVVAWFIADAYFLPESGTEVDDLTPGEVTVIKTGTPTGNFDQELPADPEPAEYQVVAIWCDDFDLLFGDAVLSEP